MTSNHLALLLIFLSLNFVASTVYAQDDLMAQAEVEEEAVPPQPEPRLQALSIGEKALQQAPNPGLNKIHPLLFLKDEYQLLQEAKASFVTRPPRPSEIEDGLPNENVQPGIRELSLAGIVYRSHKDWTIWFNEQRITPQAIPSEILDLHVHKDFIEIKWYDEYTNQIFPVRMRPHQRFNLDTRIFLPG